MYDISELEPAETAAYTRMTYPASRPLLEDRASRADGRGLVAVGASLLGRPVGLAVGAPRPEARRGVLLSIFVAPGHRKAGVGTRLLQHLQDALSARGLRVVTARYNSASASVEAIERLLAGQGWTPGPGWVTLLRSPLDRIRLAPWFATEVLPEPFSVVSWTDVTPEDRGMLDQEREWGSVPAELDPLSWEAGCDRRCSLALRHDRRIVGWMLSHEVAPHRLRISSGWVLPDLQRVGRQMPLLALFSTFVESAQGAGYREAEIGVVAQESAMSRFAARRLAPYVDVVGEVRVLEKRL